MRALQTPLVKEEVARYAAHIWVATGLRDVSDNSWVIGLSQRPVTLRLLHELVVLCEDMILRWSHI